MKRFFYMVLLGIAVSSCQTAKVVYDDVYEAAETPQKIDDSDGYADYVKDNEGKNKVVVEDKKTTSFGGFYSDNKTTAAPIGTIRNTGSGMSYDRNNNCDCCYRNHYSINQYNPYAYFPSSYFNSPYNSGFGFNNCTCNCCNHYGYYDSFYGMHYGNMGLGMAYGYYDYWGTWHSYYPGYNPYGYNYAFNPYTNGGWNSGYWYNGVWYGNGWYNNGYNSGNWSNNIASEPVSSGNHYYGHRGSVSTGSSNTTEYAHTVKNTNGSDSHSGERVLVVSGLSSFTPTDNVSDGSTQVVTTGEKIRPVVSTGSITTGGSMEITGNTTPVNTGFIPVDGSTGTAVAAKENHVVAANPFQSTSPGSAYKNTTGGTQTSGYSGYDSQQKTYDNSGYSSGRYTPVVVTSGNSGENSSGSTSRSESSERNSGSTNWNSTNTESSRSSGNTTSGHRSTTTSSGSSSGNSGSSGSTGTSRR